jgi:hypothetical protein
MDGGRVALPPHGAFFGAVAAEAVLSEQNAA